MPNQTDRARSRPQLLTIPVSHFCEKTRWALDWVGLAYEERPHVPLFHRLATRASGGTSVPVLVAAEGSLTDSRDILHYLDARASSERALYPRDPERAREVAALEAWFDRELGPAARRWAYYYQLGDHATLRQAWCMGTPRWERVGFELGFPLMCELVRRAYRPTPAGASAARDCIQSTFETVGERLNGSGPYLGGETPSAADLTFAALAAPVLLPECHPVMPPLSDRLPAAMATAVRQWRATPAGQFALNLYRYQRGWC
ncbi:MAG: glutathione S-transferase [Cyanobacteria bacterium QS_8_64_29]|nr:MAG: glutathione S-transferase [Cyanobacteria bacterium QS_8_64_29]